MTTENMHSGCPFCSGKDYIEGKSIFEGSIYMKNSLGDYKAHEIIHVVCSTCGAMLKSKVKKEPLCSCGLCKSISKYN